MVIVVVSNALSVICVYAVGGVDGVYQRPGSGLAVGSAHMPSRLRLREAPVSRVVGSVVRPVSTKEEVTSSDLVAACDPSVYSLACCWYLFRWAIVAMDTAPDCMMMLFSSRCIRLGLWR